MLITSAIEVVIAYVEIEDIKIIKIISQKNDLKKIDSNIPLRSLQVLYSFVWQTENWYHCISIC